MPTYFLPPANVPPAIAVERETVTNVTETVMRPATRIVNVPTKETVMVPTQVTVPVVTKETVLETPVVSTPAPVVVATTRNWWRIIFIIALVLLIVGLGLFIWFAVDDLNGQRTVWIILSVVFGVLLIGLAVYYFGYRV